MLPVAFLHDYAETMSPYKATAYVLIAAGVLTLITGFLRRGRLFLRHAPGVVYLLACAVLFLPGVPQRGRPALLALIGAAFLLHFVLRRNAREEPDEPPSGSSRVPLIYAGAVLACLAVFLFDGMGEFSGTMFNWEAAISREFGVRYLEGLSIRVHALECLLWCHGAMTWSHLSLLYGAPTYALIHLTGFSTWTLRFPSVIYSLLSVPVFFFIGRRFFSPLIGAVAAVLLAWSPIFLLYARMGCSPAAGLFGVLCAVFLTWLFLASGAPSWWMGPACGLSLCLATLQYAPGRIVACILLGLVPAVFLAGWRRLRWKRLMGGALIAVIVSGFFYFQKIHHRDALFLRGGGEQFFVMCQHPDFYKIYLDRTVRQKEITLRYKSDLLLAMIRRNIRDYRWLLEPHTKTTPPIVLKREPPWNPLYYAPLFPFIACGFVSSLLRARRSWRHGFLLAWFGVLSISALMCSQVNCHRVQLLIVPLLLWGAFGIGEAAGIMRQARLPRGVPHICAVVLILLMMLAGVAVYSYRDIPPNPARQAVLEEVATIHGPVIVATNLALDHMDASLINLALLERTRRDPAHRRSTLLEQVDGRIETDIREGKLAAPPVPEEHMRYLEGILRTSSLILFPANRFEVLGRSLRERGHTMIARNRRGYASLLFPSSGETPGTSSGVQGHN